MSVELTLSGTNLTKDELRQLTEDLTGDLRSAGIAAGPKKGEAAVGSRGEPITVGVIVLAAITSGTTVALFQAVKAFFDRPEHQKKKLVIEVGDKGIRLDSQNMTAEDIQKASESLKSLEPAK